MTYAVRYIPTLLLLALFVTTGTAPAQTQDSASGTRLELEVSLSERMLTVRAGDEVLGSYPVAVGKSKHPTPTGTFHIRRVIWNPSWTPPNAAWARGKKAKKPGDPKNPMGRVKIFFAEPDYFIHGTDQEESIGEAASHGCIRMRNEDVIALARLVMEHGGEARPASWFESIIDRRTVMHEVQLSSPVAVRVRREGVVAAAR
jgi:lipoprotein-anchoring transpeptidase ErfK/SrfK